MKRKRNQNEESNNNLDKKLRYDVDEEVNHDESNVYSEIDNSLIERKEEFVLTREIADNAILCDITGSQWRIGAPVGKGSFGEIYLASNDITRAVTVHNANYVTKIEPHSNGPLFVEIHCLLNVNKQDEKLLDNDDSINETKINNLDLSSTTGIPKYIASGSHFFNDIRYRFLIMPRYEADLHSITKSNRLSRKHFLILASQIIDVLKHLHEKHYVHSDIKAQNIMIGQCAGSNHHYQQTPSKLPNLNISKNLKSSLSVQYSGANPLRTCRIKENGGSHDKAHHSVYNDMVQSHYLRPGRSVMYAIDENSRSSHTQESEISDDDSDEDEDFKLSGRNKKKSRRSSNKIKRERKSSKSPLKSSAAAPVRSISSHNSHSNGVIISDDYVHLIDFGLATKFVDTNGEHKPFCMDQRRAHDGTLEFTSRDAHFGAHSRRSDLECFGYNLIYWSEGYLPWKDEKLKEQPEIVHRLKEIFMTDVKEMLKLFYGKDVPKYLGDYMNYVGQLEFDEEPDYSYLSGLFEKEFLKLGFKKSGMKLNLNEIREQCEPINRNISEHDLMMANITDFKTATKLGFLVTSDSVDGIETLVKPNESTSLNLSCKASPKNLRSKEKTLKGKRPKRQRKLTEKEIISEKIAKGKKLSIHEIATLDPEQIARDRAEKEYEKYDEKYYYQTPQRYKGNPTYAILEIENRLKNKHNGSANVSLSANNNADIEPIKGYTKPMMDILKKQQMIVEQQLVSGQTSPVSTYQKRNREGLRNVIKPTQKNITYQNEVNGKKDNKKTLQKRGRRKTVSTGTKSHKKIYESGNETILNDANDNYDDDDEEIKQLPQKVKKRPGRPKKAPISNQTKSSTDDDDDDISKDSSSNDVKEASVALRGRRKVRRKGQGKCQGTLLRKNEVAALETEEDSVYYDIPGEGSNDGIQEEESDSEIENDNTIVNLDEENDDDDDDDDNNSDNQPIQKRLRRRGVSGSEDNSNQESISSASNLAKKRRGRYYNDEDFEVFTDEASNISSISRVTKSSVSFKPNSHHHHRHRRGPSSHDSGINTRNKMKSRSTSRSAAATENSEHSEEDEEEEDDEGSEFEADSGDESDEHGIDYDHDQNISEEEEEEENAEDSSEMDDDDNDSIDIKYSPIKTRHARRRINCFSMKQIRGRRINVLNESVRNFRLVSTRG